MEFQGTKWPTCPVRGLVNDPKVAYVRQLHELSRISPLSGWPRLQVAWVVHTMAEYRAAVIAVAAYRDQTGG